MPQIFVSSPLDFGHSLSTVDSSFSDPEKRFTSFLKQGYRLLCGFLSRSDVPFTLQPPRFLIRKAGLLPLFRPIPSPKCFPPPFFPSMAHLFPIPFLLGGTGQRNVPSSHLFHLLNFPPADSRESDETRSPKDQLKLTLEHIP